MLAVHLEVLCLRLACEQVAQQRVQVRKSIIPVVMAGVLGIYGLITAATGSEFQQPKPVRHASVNIEVIINGKMDAANYSAYSGAFVCCARDG